MNRELALLYWSIGREILRRQRDEGLEAGTRKFVERLAKDLRAEFPDAQGLSPHNLNSVGTFVEAWSDEAIAPRDVSM